MNNSTILPSVAFLGMGLMGQPLARRLLGAGYRVAVWNRTPGKAEALAQAGAEIAYTLTDAVGKAQILITMLEAGPVVHEIIEAALRAMQSGTLVIDMSSTRQSEAQTLHALLLSHHIEFIDAPVSGGVVGAEAGSLAIMVGGSVENYQRAESILKVMGRPTHVGSAGCGQLAKLCNQLIVGGTLSIVAEALLLAQAGGANPASVRDAIRGGFAESRILEVHGQRMLDRNFMPGGQIKSQTKDLENVLIAATAANLELPLTALITQQYRNIMQIVPNADQSAALLALERLNPGQRLGISPDKLPD